jgi:hypothetical protein
MLAEHREPGGVSAGALQRIAQRLGPVKAAGIRGDDRQAAFS